MVLFCIFYNNGLFSDLREFFDFLIKFLNSCHNNFEYYIILEIYMYLCVLPFFGVWREVWEGYAGLCVASVAGSLLGCGYRGRGERSCFSIFLANSEQINQPSDQPD